VKGVYVHKAAPTLEQLATLISKTIQSHQRRGLLLDDWIGVVDRKHMKRIVSDMKKMSKEKRSPFYKSYVTLLKDEAYEWFATLHFGS
jgi:hypothetical protein